MGRCRLFLVSGRFPSSRALTKRRSSVLRAWLPLLAFCFLTPLSSLAQTSAQAASFAEATQAMQQGNLDAAGAGFAAVVKQMPTFAEAHFNLGLVRQEQGQFDEAIASFRKALA